MSRARKSCPTCGKVRFPRRKVALTALNAAKHRYGKNVTRVYQCPYCGDWHLTSRP